MSDVSPGDWQRWQRETTWDEYVSCDGCTAANKRFQALWEAGEIDG